MSCCVAAFPSLHGAPSSSTGASHTPALQVPAKKTQSTEQRVAKRREDLGACCSGLVGSHAHSQPNLPPLRHTSCHSGAVCERRGGGGGVRVVQAGTRAQHNQCQHADRSWAVGPSAFMGTPRREAIPACVTNGSSGATARKDPPLWCKPRRHTSAACQSRQWCSQPRPPREMRSPHTAGTLQWQRNSCCRPAGPGVSIGQCTIVAGATTRAAGRGRLANHFSPAGTSY